MTANEDVQAVLAHLAQDEFTRAVSNDLARYHATGDARFVWKAIARYAEADKPLPMDYVRKLAEWGGKLQQLSVPKDIAAALELSGDKKHKIGPKYSADYSENGRIFSEVQLVQQSPYGPAIGIKEAIRIVARNRKLPVNKVHNAYFGIKKRLRKPPRETGANRPSSLRATVHRCR